MAQSVQGQIVGINFSSVKKENIVLFAVFAAPFLTILHWSGAFFAYLLAACFLKYYISRIPIFYYIKFAMILVLMVVHSNSIASVTNLITYVVADLYCIAVGAVLIRHGIIAGCAAMARVCLYMMLIGVPVSMAAAVAMDVINPITWFFQSGRLLVLQREGAGHSILIEAATIMLCAVLAGTWKPGVNRLVMATVLAAALMAAGSSTAALMMVAVVGVAMFERLTFPLLKTLLHVLAIGSVIVVLSNPVRLNETLGWFRGQIAGQDTSVYRQNDYTAGRAMLNLLLVNLTQQAPVVGVGDDHPVLRHGVRTVTLNERDKASSESPLRLAAKYGWPLFAWSMLIAAMPLIAGLMMTGAPRRFLVPLGYAILISTATNASFSVAQSPTYVLFGPLVAFAIFAWQGRFVSDRA